MGKKSVYEFYQQALVPLSPKPELIPLLKAVMNCGETTKDFVWALRNDHELQGWLRHTVMAMGFDPKTSGLEQIITLIGQNKVRDILLGRSIEQTFVDPSETLMSRHFKGKKKPTPASPESEEDMPQGEAPPVAEFTTYLGYAKKAEEVANLIRESYPWQAFVGGLLYDYLGAYVKSRRIEKTEGITRSDLLSSKAYVDGLFYDGLRSAIASIEVLQKITIKHQKNVFIASLLHNCGEAILMGFDALAYQEVLNFVDLKQKIGVVVPLAQEQQKLFAFDNAQAASLFLGRLPFLHEVDRVIDYSTSPKMLRMRDSNLYAMHCVIRIGSMLAKLFHKNKSTQSDILKIADESISKSEEFLFLKLDANEWKSIKSNYALKIMKSGL